jgi:hypothetical protein
MANQGISMRGFSSREKFFDHTPIDDYRQEINENLIDKLLVLQKNFENDTSDLMAAEEYLRELNRQGKITTVIRLYQKYELHFRSNQRYS